MEKIVSIRFHRGGLSHIEKNRKHPKANCFNPLSSRWSVSLCWAHTRRGRPYRFNPLSSRWSVSLTPHYDGVTRKCFNPLSSRWSVSQTQVHFHIEKLFQSAFIAVVCLTRR